MTSLYLGGLSVGLTWYGNRGMVIVVWWRSKLIRVGVESPVTCCVVLGFKHLYVVRMLSRELNLDRQVNHYKCLGVHEVNNANL